VTPQMVIAGMAHELRERRLELRLWDRRWTQAYVGLQVGVSAETLNSWENGRKIPSAPHLATWAAALDMRLLLAKVPERGQR
jgi:DNA-binding XRE family transcriptional regulator